MAADLEQRLQDELLTIGAIYPDQTTWTRGHRELKFESDHSRLELRLPDEYLSTALPTILIATAENQDLRQALSDKVNHLTFGEEVLDAIIAAFLELVHEREAFGRIQAGSIVASNRKTDDRKATVVIWLHHLLNTNKRKLALSPASSVSGITKPGYPGVLIYSGPHAAVHDHVDELKSQKWAAFQVRLDGDEAWVFQHGTGVKEVENLGDVVKAIGEQRKEDFMEAMRMK